MVQVISIGHTNWRDNNILFGIDTLDRFGHIYAIGKTGVGKSTLLLNMAIADIKFGNGICVIDPHGDVAEKLLDNVPVDRIEDVIYINPQDIEFPIGFNPLSNIPPDQYHLVVSGLISTFKKSGQNFWGPRLEYILRFSLLTLLDYPGATLLDIQSLLTDIHFRNKVLDQVSNTHIIRYWKQEFEKYPSALKAEAISPILNKTGTFLTSLPLRNILGQSVSKISIEEIVNTRKILIVNLAKGQIGEDSASILGSMIITAIQLSVMKRSTISEETRIPFYLYVDEMHSFVSMSFIDILAEARKYKLALFLTHQYIEQINEKIRSAIFGNVGTIITFRLGAADAPYLAKEFSPVFDENDFINLPKYSIYIKLMIEGTTSKPFSATTLPVVASTVSVKKEIIERNRLKYATRREIVETEIFSKVQLFNSTNLSTLFDK